MATTSLSSLGGILLSDKDVQIATPPPPTLKGLASRPLGGDDEVCSESNTREVLLLMPLLSRAFLVKSCWALVPPNRSCRAVPAATRFFLQAAVGAA